MKTYRNELHVDEPSGPWSVEPDRAVWVDPDTNLDCMIHRNNSGALCGYVGVPPDHQWHGKGYDHTIEVGPDWYDRPIGKRGVIDVFCMSRDGNVSIGSFLNVHGGLTFSGPCNKTGREERGICHAQQPGRPENIWWFGFDCSHDGDFSPKYDHLFSNDNSYRDFQYVKSEVESLAKQLTGVERK